MARLIVFLLMFWLMPVMVNAYEESSDEKPDLKLYSTKGECYLLIVPKYFNGLEPKHRTEFSVKSPNGDVIYYASMDIWESEESTDNNQLMESIICLSSDYIEYAELILRYDHSKTQYSPAVYKYKNLKNHIQEKKISLY